MSYLAKAIEWKYGNSAQARCNLETDTIEEWRHPSEPMPDVQALLAEYEPVRLQRMQDAQDLEEIRNDQAINDLISKRPSEIDDHYGQVVNVPTLAEQVALLTKQVKLLSK
jgi:hypothetical protein